MLLELHSGQKNKYEQEMSNDTYAPLAPSIEKGFW